MKKILIFLFFLLSVSKGFSQSYMIIWNSTNSNYEIKQLNLNTGAISNIGTSLTMSSYYDINEIYFDQANNQIVALYQGTDLWKYNLSSNTDQILDLGSVTYRDLVVTDQNSYLIIWNSTNSNYEIKQLNLNTGAISNIGTSLTMSSYYDINEIYFDQANNQIVALYQGTDLWKYNLSSNTDQILDLGSVTYRDFVVTGQNSYLIIWNSTNSNYEIKQLNLSTGGITNVGTSLTMSSYYDINEVYFDQANNQIVALYQGTDLWKYNLSSNTDQIVDLGSVTYRDLTVTDPAIVTGIMNSSVSQDDIIKIFDITGAEVTSIEPNRPLIYVYKSGKTKKVYLEK